MKDNIVLLNLRISMWGVNRVVADHDYEVDADKAMVRATKKILECPEYEFLLQLKRSVHRVLRSVALSGEALRAGVYPVSIDIWSRPSRRPWRTRKKLVGVDRLLQFLDTFRKQDVADDEQLRVLVDQARDVLHRPGHCQPPQRPTPAGVCGGSDAERMQSVKVVLDTMVQESPTRQMVLRD